MLYKIRSPGGDNVTNADLERDTIPIYRVKAPFGRVVYTHGLGIDQPVSVIRMGYSSTWAAPVAVIPHANWRGSFDQGTFDNGAYTRCTKNAQGLNSGDCVFVDWPGDNQRVFENPGTVVEPRSWFGHQVSGQRDFSGLFYRRNRYYDAFQGRFTQEDPLGLAGGLNLYGFAAGDPVTFSDPLGLGPCENVPPGACKGWLETLQKAQEYWDDVSMFFASLPRQIAAFFPIGQAATAIIGYDENGDKVGTGGRILAGAIAATGPLSEGFEISGQLEKIWNDRRLFAGWLKGTQSLARIGNPLTEVDKSNNRQRGTSRIHGEGI